jgi:hypothetical protein
MFLEKVLGGAFTLFALFMMMAFVLWLVVEYPFWVLFTGIVTTMLVINYFRK